MAVDAIVEPWWVAARAPWRGRLFDEAILGPDHPGEQRIQRLRARALERPAGLDGTLSIHRARLFTRAWRAAEGEPPMLRRARAIAHVFEEIPIAIQPDELIVGTPGAGPGAVEVEPEFMAAWLLSPVEVEGRSMTELDAIPVRRHGRFGLDPEVRRELAEEILPYWRERCHPACVERHLARFDPDALAYAATAQVFAPNWGKGFSHTVQDYAGILRRGLLAVVLDLDRAMATLDPTRSDGLDAFDRRDCLAAMQLCARGVLTWAERHARLADELAAAEPDPLRAEELRTIAAVCRRVPAHPARSWWEALQGWHFLHAGTHLAEGGASHSAGRFDQYMLPFLEDDFARGALAPERAQELLECFFLEFYDKQQLRDLAGSRALAGDRTNDKLTIGGVDRRGRDAGNRLSRMLLEAQAHVFLKEPNLSVRVHRRTPEDFLLRALEVMRLGAGLPQLISDEVIVPALVAQCGVSLEDARDYADIGCQENVTDPNMGHGADANGHNNAGWFNLLKPIELALWDGVNPLGGRQVGPRTGDPRGLSTMAAFLQAVQGQLAHAVRLNVAVNNAIEACHVRFHPSPFHDLMHPGPRQSGRDYNAGGCRYNWTGAIGVGLANAADALAAVATLVYGRGGVTWDELLQALAANWEGHADLRRRVLAAPRYGTDDPAADRWAQEVVAMFADAYGAHRTCRGGPFVVGFFTMGTYVPMGQRVGATPDGRRRGEPLADAVNAAHATEVASPTAMHRSAASFDTLRTPNGITFNQRFSLASVTTDRDLRKWADLVRTYVDLGGQSVQYSIANRDVLLDAKRHPERYRDLLVRVGGYSARFVDLSPEVQDAIIAKTDALA